MREINLNKKQFSEFNDYDQFQIFADDAGFSNFDTVASDTDKLFDRFDFVVVTEKDDIFGVKNGTRELLVSDATEAYSIALEVTEGFN